MKSILLFLSIVTMLFCSDGTFCFEKDYLKVNEVIDGKLYIKTVTITRGCYDNIEFDVVKETLTEEGTLTTVKYDPIVELYPGSYCVCPLKKK